MSDRNAKKPPIAAVITALVIVVLFVVAGGYAIFSNLTVHGGTTTPSGVPVQITGNAFGFSIGGDAETTQVDMAGHVIEFGASTVKVDGVTVGNVDESVKEITLTVTRKNVEILGDGKPLPPPK